MIKFVLRAALGLALLAGPALAQGPGQLGSGELLGNASASRAPAGPTTPSAILDRALCSTQGGLLVHNASAWVCLAPGTAGLPLVSGGAGANLGYAILGLSGGGTNAALTASNGGILYSTASAAAILSGTATAGQIVRSGASGPPSWSTATYPATATQGDVLYASAANVIGGLAKNASASRYLSNSGASNAPAWAQVDLTNGVTGATPIANGGTNCSVASGTCLDNITGFSTTGIASRTGSGTYTFSTLSALMDSGLCSTRGNVIYRGASTWSCLAVGTSGQVLQTGGAGADPSWTTTSGLVSISNNQLLANTTGGSALPSGQQLVDALVSSSAAIASSKLSYTTTLTGGVARSGLSKWADKISVKDFGCLGNSNGTTGNGNNDTACIQLALDTFATGSKNATSSSVFFPCGVYRVTTTLTGSAAFPATYYIKGDGLCSKIYFDNASGIPLFDFSPSAGTGSAQPQVIIEDIYLPTPVTPASTIAFRFTHVANPTINRVVAYGWGTFAKYIDSFVPHVIGSTIANSRGYAIDCSTDLSCNSGVIRDNTITGSGITSSLPAIILGPGAGATSCSAATNAIVIEGNDIEGGYSAIGFNGACGVSVIGNYLELNTSTAFSRIAGTNAGIRFNGNWFYSNGASDTFAMANLTGVTFDGNIFYNSSITDGGSNSDVRFGYNKLEGTSALPAIDGSTFKNILAGGGAGQVPNGVTGAFTATPTLGASGTLGSITMGNATSGTILLRPVTGALGSVTVSLPAATDTLVGKATTDTLTNKTYDTAGTGNSFSINGLAATANTGTGAVVRATSAALVTPDIGTPSAGVLTNATGLPIAGITGLATGMGTWLGTPSSANLRATLTDETGTGLAYFQGGDIGTPSAGVATNITGLNGTNISTGTVPIARLPSLPTIIFGTDGTNGVLHAVTQYLMSLSNTTESKTAPIAPFAGTFKNLYVKASGAPGGAQTYIMTWRVNGADTAVTCTITGAATSCNDTTHTAAITAGQAFTLKAVGSATAADVNMTFGIELDTP